MVHKGRRSSPETEDAASSAGGKIGIHHPAPDSSIAIPFVASGTAPDNVEFVVGRLKNKQTGTIIHRGIPLPLPQPQRWAIYFRRSPALASFPVQSFTLEVLGMVVDDQGQVTVVWQDAVNLTLPIEDEIEITWPDDGESDLCASNFVPYGTYGPAGTITAILDTGDRQIQPPWIYYDPPNSFWSAPFDPISPVPTQDCTLTVELDDSGDVSMQTKNNLGFEDC